MTASDAGLERAIRDALALLGIRRLAFAIHDASFPTSPDEDVGSGSPYAPEAARLLEFVRAQGFDAIQFGPQGETSADNASPYDSSQFARSTLSIRLGALCEERFGALLSRERVAALAAAAAPGSDTRVDHPAAWRLQQSALEEAWRGLRAREVDPALAPLRDALAAFQRAQAPWLEHDARYEAARFGPDASARFRFAQFLAHGQHAELRARASRLGLALLADVQVGFSERDRFEREHLFLDGWWLGAPPSRTNPLGQPWGYPVFDPARYCDPDGGPGPVLRYLAARIEKLVGEFDGLRLDHPHGYVCPWVYRATGDPVLEVQRGARLFASPDLPELRRYAIVQPHQLRADPGAPRHADDWVVELTPEHVERYGALVAVIVEGLRARGRSAADLACEVLSTLPRPLERVLERHGIGRFRVSQKVDLDDPGDPYRLEVAAPDDWVMVSTHDTPPLWSVVELWARDGKAARHAAHLAERLAPGPETQRRGALRALLERDPALLAQAKLSELFLGPARNVMVFFADVFGLTGVYNTPGTVGPHNWSLRVPPDWLEAFGASLAAHRALDVPLALALALRARGLGEPALRARLEASAAGRAAPHPLVAARSR